MTASRKVIRIFIVSPGDLNEEQPLFRDIVSEVNRIKANSMGIQLEPVGWEDTLPGKGRPQELINADVKQSDLVVMLLWKRWGSPTGIYTSGFEEEYELAKSLNEKVNGKPEMWLYFRAIPEYMLADPGEQLKKVLDFRNRIETGKRFLYGSYEAVGEWERLFREHLCRWLDNLNILEQKLDREDEIPLGTPSPEVEVKNPRVFLSYIREEGEIAKNLKSELIKRGIKIWIDKEQILPGDKWKETISDAIRSCEFAIICLSKKSLSKEGYFQKELKEINTRAELLPRTRTFRIPVRLDDCVIPDELKEIHAIDLFKDWEAGVKGITKSIVANSSNVSLQQQMMEIPKIEIPIEHLKGILQTLVKEAIEKAESGQVTKAEEYFAIATAVPTDINALNLYGLFLQRIGMLKRAEEKFKQIEDFAQKTGDRTWVAIAYGNLGNLYLTRGDLKAAEEMYKKSLAIEEELGRKEGMAIAYGNLGNLYLTRGDLKAAEEMYKKSLAIEEELGRKEGMAIAYGNLGNLYLTRGDLKAAEEMYKKSLAINEELGRKEGMAIAYGNLGILHKTRGDLKAAEEMYKKSLAINEELGRKEGMASDYGNLGILHETRGDLKAAEEMYKKSLAIEEELGRKEGMASGYGNLGILHETRGDLKAAEEMYKKSLAIEEELGRKEGMASDYGNLGNLYLTRGDLKAAEEMYKKSLAIFASIGNKLMVKKIEKLMEELKDLRKEK